MQKVKEIAQSVFKSLPGCRIKYIRNRYFSPVGVIVTYNDGIHKHIGYSLCGPQDKFNRHEGFLYAVSRTVSFPTMLKKLANKTVHRSAAGDVALVLMRAGETVSVPLIQEQDPQIARYSRYLTGEDLWH